MLLLGGECFRTLLVMFFQGLGAMAGFPFHKRRDCRTTRLQGVVRTVSPWCLSITAKTPPLPSTYRDSSV